LNRPTSYLASLCLSGFRCREILKYLLSHASSQDERGTVREHVRKMDRPQRETTMIILLIAGGSATLAALVLGYVAHYDFELSRQQIRTPAVLGAVLIGVLMAVEFSARGCASYDPAILASRFELLALDWGSCA